MNFMAVRLKGKLKYKLVPPSQYPQPNRSHPTRAPFLAPGAVIQPLHRPLFSSILFIRLLKYLGNLSHKAVDTRWQYPLFHNESYSPQTQPSYIGTDSGSLGRGIGDTLQSETFMVFIADFVVSEA